MKQRGTIRKNDGKIKNNKEKKKSQEVEKKKGSKIRGKLQTS